MRDPRTEPRAGDAILSDGSAYVIGEVDDAEVMYGCGDHRYWYKPLDQWRDDMKEATVLHVAEEVVKECAACKATRDGLEIVPAGFEIAELCATHLKRYRTFEKEETRKQWEAELERMRKAGLDFTCHIAL